MFTARFYEDAGRADAAERALRAALRHDDVWSHDGSRDVHGRAHLALGVLLMRRERGELVLRALVAAEEAAAAAGRPVERALYDPMHHLRAAVRLLPDLAAAHSSLGVLLDERGRSGEALRAHTRVVELLDSRDAPGALPGIPRGATQATPSEDRAQALFNLGLSHYTRGAFDEALRAFARAAPIDAGNAALHANIGATLVKLGRRGEAKAALLRSLQIDPNGLAARNNLALLSESESGLP